MIQELVNFCDASFAPNTEGFSCHNAPVTSCPDCLKDIHFNKVSGRKYDCVNMCHWYVCQNIYRYASEMVWQLHDKELGLRSRKSALNICSIGCGPCSELIAIGEYRKKHGLLLIIHILVLISMMFGILFKSSSIAVSDA